MKKYAALAAAAVVVALAGCSAVAPAPTPQPTSWAVQPAQQNRPAAPDIQGSPIAEHVWANWQGPHMPDSHWIETSATLACKRMNGGLEPRILTEGVYAEWNNALITTAARKLVCPLP